MQLHVDEIASRVTPGAHAVVIVDQAGWHTTKKLILPHNITLLPLPPRAPELNPVDQCRGPGRIDRPQGAGQDTEAHRAAAPCVLAGRPGPEELSLCAEAA